MFGVRFVRSMVDLAARSVVGSLPVGSLPLRIFTGQKMEDGVSAGVYLALWWSESDDKLAMTDRGQCRWRGD